MTTKSPLVVLLHGAGGNAWTMLALDLYLRHQCGVARTLCPAYASNAPSIDDAVASVEASLREHASPDTDELIVIGQSLGGVIGYRLAASGRWRIRLLITIAAPLHGSALVAELQAEWPLIYPLVHRPVYTELARGERVPPPSTQYHCFTTGWAWSSFDGCVFIDEARFADDDAHHTHFVWGDHRFIVADVRLVSAVANRVMAASGGSTALTKYVHVESDIGSAGVASATSR